MKLGVTYLALGIGLLVLATRQSATPALVLSLSAGVAFVLIGAAYLFAWPGVLGKTRSGKLLGSSYLLFWPYHLLNYLSLLIARWLRNDEPMHEVLPGLWQGSRLLPWDKERAIARRFVSVLDLTCELSEAPFLRNGLVYFCIPLLDRTAPSPTQLEAGLRFIADRLPKGPLYVHCAMGHGRSSVFTLGYLLKSGKSPSCPEALSFLREKRSRVRINAAQLKALEFCFDERRNL